MGEAVEEYMSSLADLTINSKPLINMLTMLAEDNSNVAALIVQAIEQHIAKVSPEVKLPVLYLIDSIVKNVSNPYVSLFTNNIVQIFAGVFEKVDEKTRMSMYKLRQTWTDIFSPVKMYALDVRINHMDSNWPVPPVPPTSIHLNPKFLNKAGTPPKLETPPTATVETPAVVAIPSNEATLRQKQKILQELQQKKRELELIQQKVWFGETLNDASVNSTHTAVVRPVINTRVNNGSKATTKAVITPPAPSVTTNQPIPPKTKIAPPNSLLIAAAAAAVPSRDPRLARQQAAAAQAKPEPEPRPEIKDPRRKKKSPIKPNKPEKNEKSEKQERIGDMGANLLDDLLRKQKQQLVQNTKKTRQIERKVPEVTETEEQIQQRQMAMLKAPVLGQLNRKNSDSHSEKSRKPRTQIISHSNNDQNRRKHDDKDSKSKRRSRVSRDKPKSRSSESQSKRSKPRVRTPSPAFSPPEDDEPITDPIPVEPIPSDFEALSPPSSPPSPPTTPPPPVISSQETNTVVDMEIEEEEEPQSLPTTKPEPFGFKNRKGSQKSRNYSRRNKERSVTPPVDVDLRVTATNNLQAASEELVDVGKDVDLRMLARASPKKRLSTDMSSEEPAAKKNKSDDVMALFGNQDMDERLPPRSLQTPPPPTISTSPPAESPAEDSSQNAQTTWADVKPRPEATVKPMTLLSRHLEQQVADMEKAELERKWSETSEDERDRLGRPLLYNRLPNDPRARRESLNQHDDVQNNRRQEQSDDLHVDQILLQAREQLNRGTMSSTEYNKLMAQIVRINEDQKIRDAQRQRRHFREVGRRVSPPLGGPGQWRPRLEDDSAPFARRWRGGGGPRGGPRGRFPGNQRWRDHQNRFPQEGHSPDWLDQDSRSQDAGLIVDVPPTDMNALEILAAHADRHICIDKTPRAIRFYGDQAVVILSPNAAREISFENGMRHVYIAGLELPVQIHGPPVPFLFQNITHKARLGAPTRELYIDDRFFEINFGGPPLQIELSGAPCTVQLEGPPPQVSIAPHSNNYCLGSVCLFIDARTYYTIYLDSKPQRFEINGCPLILTLADRLSTVLINGVPVPLKFGGNPVPINFCNAQYFLRLTDLPSGVTEGKISIWGMDKLGESPLLNQESNSQDNQIQAKKEPSDFNRGIYADVVSSMMGGVNNVDMKSSFNYQLQPDNTVPTQAAPAASVIPNLNINDLFQSLLATGIISNNPEPKIVTNLPQVKRVDFHDSNSLKEPQPGVVGILYSGIQCGSCGVRFPPEETKKYSQHLDWHFRQNRRDRDAARRGSSRRWYYDVSDWIQFEEIEDLEERAQSWFETEGGLAEDVTEEEEMRSVPAPSGGLTVCCEVCRDRFDTFFHEETEEWHLRNCVLVDEKYYHPVCHQDSVKMPEEPLAVEKMTSVPLLEPLVEEPPVKMEQSVVIVDDDDVKDEDDVEIVTVDEEDVLALIHGMIDHVVMEEECDASPIEDDELEVLAVTNKDANKPPVDVIDVPEAGDDDEIFRPPSPALFDPNMKIKQEPIDEMESAVALVDQTSSTVQSTIDGNVELSEAPSAPASAPSKIKITFTKPPPAIPEPVTKVIEPIDPTELQIEEIEPEPLPLKPKKPRIASRNMTEYPTVQKGTELSGLCSIM